MDSTIEQVEEKGFGALKGKNETEQVKLSENIQKFDSKPRVYTENPYSFNAISLNQDKSKVQLTASAQEMQTNPTYHTIGKFLGVDAAHEWNKYYDKVFTITEWAKMNAEEKDIGGLISWISDKSRTIPSTGSNNLNNLYLFARLEINK